MTRTALTVWADGLEEIEAITPVDILRRAGVQVIVAGLNSLDIEGAHGIHLKVDILLQDAPEGVDALFFPGGQKGSENLGANVLLRERIRKHHTAGSLVAAICAAPALVLSPAGVLEGRRATCYPGFESHFSKNVKWVRDRVVKDGNVLTSRGPGTAMEFALALAAELTEPALAAKISFGTLHSS